MCRCRARDVLMHATSATTLYGQNVKNSSRAIQGGRCAVTTRGTAEQDEQAWCNVPRKPRGDRSMPGKVLFVVLFAALCLSCSRGESARTPTSDPAPVAADGRDASGAPPAPEAEEEATSIHAQASS